MPINNITQTISTLPPAGKRGVDVQTQFVIKQEDFQDHLQGTTVTELNTLKDQLNSRISEINSTATTMNGYANTASAGASTATTKAGEASTSASEALAYRNQAETFKNNASNSATKASQWADNNYNVEVETGKYSAKHWSTVAQNTLTNKLDTSAYTASDVLTKLKTVDGNGSGLDADLLDGLDSTEFMRKSTDNVITKSIIFNNNTTDSNGFSFISNTGATPPQDINVDMYNGTLRWFRNNGLAPLSIGTDNNLYSDNGVNGNGRILTTTTPLGYSTSALGVGGTAVQDTSKSTAVTLNKLTGLIVTANSALAAGASATFTLNNNQIGANDGFYITPYYGYIDPYNYKIEVIGTYNGGARIKITNISTGSLSDIVQFKFQVIKGVIS